MDVSKNYYTMTLLYARHLNYVILHTSRWENDRVPNDQRDNGKPACGIFIKVHKSFIVNIQKIK